MERERVIFRVVSVDPRCSAAEISGREEELNGLYVCVIDVEVVINGYSENGVGVWRGRGLGVGNIGGAVAVKEEIGPPSGSGTSNVLMVLCNDGDYVLYFVVGGDLGGVLIAKRAAE